MGTKHPELGIQRWAEGIAGSCWWGGVGTAVLWSEKEVGERIEGAVVMLLGRCRALCRAH